MIEEQHMGTVTRGRQEREPTIRSVRIFVFFFSYQKYNFTLERKSIEY